MKRTLIIALASFFLGIFLAGYIFVYLPEKNLPDSFLTQSPESSLSSSLFASQPTQVKAILDFAEIAEKVSPAVLEIEAEKVEKRRVLGFEDEFFEDFWRFFGSPRSRPREQEFHSTTRGSGFIISPDGYIITNNHIVQNAVKVKVRSLQGQEYTAEIIGTDPPTDLALLKVKGENLPYAELGDSSQLRAGDWVLAIGNPFGFEHTVTAGIVSAKGRQLGVGANAPEYQDFIQTDTAINPGNSGGPLVNIRGEVVGINSMISTTTGGNLGIGFAIPSDLAKKVVKQLKEKGRVVRGKIGIFLRYNLNEDLIKLLNLKSKKGALIESIEPGSPADKAGLKRYDVIVEVNGQPVENNNDLLFKIAEIQPGTKVDVKYIRDSKEDTVKVTIAAREPSEETEASKTAEKDIGFSVEEMTPRLAGRYGYQTTEGLLITKVTRYSEADRKGLEAGDIILEVDKKEVTRVEHLENILKKKNPGDPLMLLVRRETNRGINEFIAILNLPE